MYITIPATEGQLLFKEAYDVFSSIDKKLSLYPYTKTTPPTDKCVIEVEKSYSKFKIVEMYNLTRRYLDSLYLTPEQIIVFAKNNKNLFKGYSGILFVLSKIDDLFFVVGIFTHKGELAINHYELGHGVTWDAYHLFVVKNSNNH